MRWNLPARRTDAATQLAAELQIPEIAAHLLLRRGIETPQAAANYLNPSLDQLHSPFQMAEMDMAVRRLQAAIGQGEKILIYGDYDVDGMMSVVILQTALKALGAQVDTHVPDRFAEGYGMRPEVIERAARQGFKLVISVDTGVREHEALGKAHEMGMDAIVTDHHLPGEQMPPAAAILDPHRCDCNYPDKNLCGSGVALKLVQALYGDRMAGPLLRSYLKVAAIGTIADVVPLTGENRIIAYFGLEGLTATAAAGASLSSKRTGLGELLEAAGLQGKTIRAGTVGYQLAPRLNAAGRMEHARQVIDLFTNGPNGQARVVAQNLERLNRERQKTEDAILQEIQHSLEPSADGFNCYSVVVAGANWHRGVIGIVAQRVAERFWRPALVISIEGGVGHGSGRSIPGFHMLNALDSCGGLFERYGGHAKAVGFTLPASRIAGLEAHLEAYARAHLTPEDLAPILGVDAEASLGQLDEALLEVLNRFEPCGCANPTPVLSTTATVAAPPRVLKEKHLKIRLQSEGRSLEALAWGMAGRIAQLQPGQTMEFAFNLQASDFQGARSLQLVLKDWRPLSQPR